MWQYTDSLLIGCQKYDGDILYVPDGEGKAAGSGTTVEGQAAGSYASRYFAPEETACHCGCGTNNVNPLLLQKLDKMRDMIGGPLSLNSCVRCPAHNAAVGGVADSQHVKGNAADVAVPDYPHCHTPEQLAWYAEHIGFDGIGIYPPGKGNFVHVDVRSGGTEPGAYRW